MPLSFLIGRKTEITTLKEAYESQKSEFLVLYVRRRVGKTFLINQFFEGQLSFRITALSPNKVTTKQQLQSFHVSLATANPDLEYFEPPQNWFEAFQRLIKHLKEAETKTRKTTLLAMITTYGLTKNNYAQNLVMDSMDMNILFE